MGEKNATSYQDLENKFSSFGNENIKFIKVYIYNNFLDNCFGIKEGAYNQNVSLYFQFSHHSIDDPNIKIKNGDLYLIHNGQKILPSKVHFGWKDFTGEDLTGEHFIFTKKAFLVDQTGGSEKIITFPIKLQHLLDDNTKLVIEKIYYKDTVVMQNIEFGFKNDLYKECCIPYEGSTRINIKLSY